MGSELNGVRGRVPAEQRLNVFALVIYIPDPLGRFLDDLRRELVPGCNPHAHVSVLPPRPLGVDWTVAGDHVRDRAADRPPFEITLERVRMFPVTNVIYLELGEGASEMFRIHEAMNSGALEFHEPFAYHPHITLAQEIPPAEVEDVFRRAQERWAAYTGPRHFRAERAAFVQNTMGNCWIDLADYPLGTQTPVA
jgi:2'-5' RNA ligase